MAKFDLYYPTLQKHEGGYASAKTAASIGDSGGETYKGIARNYNKDWPGWKLIDKYKLEHGEPKWNSTIPIPELNEMVKKYAKQFYWDPLKLDSVNNQSLAELIYDFGFNSGKKTPIQIIQRLLKLDIVDGMMGPDTLKATNRANQKNLFDALKTARIEFLKKSTKIRDSIKPQLIERADSFFFREPDVSTQVQ